MDPIVYRPTFWLDEGVWAADSSSSPWCWTGRHARWRDQGWYHVDEVWAHSFGPFVSREDCDKDLDKYYCWLNTGVMA